MSVSTIAGGSGWKSPKLFIVLKDLWPKVGCKRECLLYADIKTFAADGTATLSADRYAKTVNWNQQLMKLAYVYIGR